jgi:hypothetical protein
MDWTAEAQSLTEAEDFSCSLCNQTSYRAHPASYTGGTRGPFPRGKAQPGRDADHFPPSIAEVKKKQELYILSPKVPPWHVMGLFSFIKLEVLSAEIDFRLP